MDDLRLCVGISGCARVYILYVCMCADMMVMVGWLHDNCFWVVVVVAGLVWWLSLSVWFGFSFVRLISKNKFIYYYFILQYDFFFFLFKEIIKTILLFQALELTWYKK